MELIETAIKGALIIEPKVFGDARGFFLESWNEAVFAAHGLPMHFVQDNHSRSARGILRGLHYQLPDAQGKLVRVVAGRAFDAIVDIRRSSPTYGKWASVELSADNKRMLWVPPGLAHGFLSLADGTDFLYKCTMPYSPAQERCIAWNDPAIGIDWPLDGLVPLLSDKDSAGLALADAETFA